jgi:hypothetical protein
MTPELRRRLAEKRIEWAKIDAEVRAIFAEREARLRAHAAYLERRRARLRRLSFGLLGR